MLSKIKTELRQAGRIGFLRVGFGKETTRVKRIGYPIKERASTI